MIRHVALWLALCLPVFGHELAIDVELQRPEVLLRASYGPGEPAAQVAVAVSSAAAQASWRISGETDESGAFAFTPPAEGEWLVRVDDGYGHIATRMVAVNWTAPAAELSEPASLLARAGAGLAVIFGLTAFVVWGRRRAAPLQP
jgi:hypothetical protein